MEEKNGFHQPENQFALAGILTFIQKVKNATIPRVFLSTFEEIEHKYTTRFSKYSLYLIIIVIDLHIDPYLLLIFSM